MVSKNDRVQWIEEYPPQIHGHLGPHYVTLFEKRVFSDVII